MSTLSQQQKQQQHQYDFVVQIQDLTKAVGPIATGVGFLDHMIDQLNSHAQIGVSIQPKQESSKSKNNNNNNKSSENDKNRFATCAFDQAVLMQAIGAQLGASLRRLLMEQQAVVGTTTSRFCCPLDEALVACELRNIVAETHHHHHHHHDNYDYKGKLSVFSLPPYGKYPRGRGRQFIGRMQTAHLQVFWSSLAEHAGLEIQLEKIRGDNAHHIVEAAFKAFSRALRNLLDGVNTVNDNNDDGNDKAQNNRTRIRLEQMYGRNSENARASIALHRQATVERSTKETSIQATVKLNGTFCQDNTIDTGITTLDQFLRTLAKHAEMSLYVTCQGDLWIDEHHTAEDVAIAVGQVLNTALGTKAGLNRMWSAVATVEQQQQQQRQQHDERDTNTVQQQESKMDNKASVEVTMDLSNRPCLTHNLPLEKGLEETVGDLSLEMMEHVLDSLVVNARMTVHMVYKDGSYEHDEDGKTVVNHANMIQAVAVAFGKALKYCSMVDYRRAGVTASSKGTLSV